MIVDVPLFEHGSHPQGLLGSGGALDILESLQLKVRTHLPLRGHHVSAQVSEE